MTTAKLLPLVIWIAEDETHLLEFVAPPLCADGQNAQPTTRTSKRIPTAWVELRGQWTGTRTRSSKCALRSYIQYHFT